MTIPSGASGVFLNAVRLFRRISVFINVSASMASFSSVVPLRRFSIKPRARRSPIWLQRDDVGNDNDHTCMERFLTVQIKKVGAIVGDEGVFLLADDLHQLPILQAAESAMSDVVSRVARCVSYGDEGCVK